MIAAQTWEPEAAYVPGGGVQRIIEGYNSAAGRYTTEYFKSVPGGDSVLAGAEPFSLAATWAGFAPMTQAVIVAALTAVGGYYGIKKFGSPRMKKLIGLSGARGRLRQLRR